MNKYRGGTQIKLGDKEYDLFPTFEAMMAFEERAKIAILQVNQEIISNNNISMRTAVAAIWSGMLGYYTEKGQEEKAPTFNQVGRMCASAGFTSIMAPATMYIMSMLASDEDREEMAKAQDEERKKPIAASKTAKKKK